MVENLGKRSGCSQFKAQNKNVPVATADNIKTEGGEFLDKLSALLPSQE
jgi:hypothetical protein